MKSLAPYLLALCLPQVFVTGQHYKANYVCDFESSDCGFHAQSDTGAYFARGAVNLGKRKTYGLVLGDLPKGGNWTTSRGRTASVWSPAIFPRSLFGKVSVSLDYYLVDRTCVDFIQLGQEADSGTRVLGQANRPNEWGTIRATVDDISQPLKVVVEAHLQPTCTKQANCRCSGNAIVDNLRISSSDMSTSTLEQALTDAHLPKDSVQPTDPELTLSAMDVAFQELRVLNRRSVEETFENLEEEEEDDALSIITPRPGMKSIPPPPPVVWPTPRPGTKSIPPIPRVTCPPAPTCPIEVEFRRPCQTSVVKECYYTPRPDFCQCMYTTECPVYRCPEILPCPPNPPCPVYPPLDPKSWDPKHYRHPLGGQAAGVEAVPAAPLHE